MSADGQVLERPATREEEDPILTLTVAIRKSEKDLLYDWAWRVRKKMSGLARDMILDGLQRLEATPDKDRRWPTPFSGEGRASREDEE
jgi:hypothetical protein